MAVVAIKADERLLPAEIATAIGDCNVPFPPREFDRRPGRGGGVARAAR